MSRTRRWSEGWPLFGCLALLITGALAATWFSGPGGEAGVRLLIRVSARISVTLFLLVFSASALRRVWRAPATAWLLRNRRQLGVSFALSHGLHLAAIVTLARRWPHPFIEAEGDLTTLVGGGLAYLLILLLALSSSDRAVAWLGARRWRLLHLVGVHYMWLIFTQAHARRASQGAGYALVTIALLAALGLRLALALRARRVSRPPAEMAP